jgi:hypothetical protein
MTSNVRGWLALGVSVGAVAVACGDDPVAQRTPAKLAQGCTLNSECVAPLICAFQRCHTACNDTRDCPSGQRCVAATGGKNVCQLPDERECVTDSGCSGDQVCAQDQQCRDACSDDDECIGSQVCANQGACAEPTEVDASGNLPNAMGSGGVSGMGGKGGSSGKGGSAGRGGMMSIGGEGGDESAGGRTGGTGGKGGSSGEGGEGAEGADGGTGGSSGLGGNGGTAGGTSGGGGMSGSAGTAGAAGGSGTAGTAGAGGSPSTCIESLWGQYAIRATDGAILNQESSQQPHIVNGVTALSLKNATSVLQGQYHGCASTEAGEAWCWPTLAGGNSQGQLGDGTQTTGTPYIALRVRKDASTTLDDVSSVATASYYSLVTSCAVSDGSVWCWGSTGDLLNNGTLQNSVYATQVTTNGTTPLSNVLSMSISYMHGCAIVDATPDEVWCWGDNQHNEAGATAGRIRYPTKVNGIVDPKAVRLTAESTYVLDGDQVKCFGRSTYYECGLNTNTSPVVSPTLVKLQNGMAMDGVTQLEGGSSDGCAVRSDQSVWCWGYTYLNYAAAQPTTMPATGVLAVGQGLSLNPRYLTSDGKYHYGANVRDPYCGPLD